MSNVTYHYSQPVLWNMIVLRAALKLEAAGMRHSTGQRASVQARKILKEAKVPCPRGLKDLLVSYSAHIEEVKLHNQYPNETATDTD